MKKKLLTTLLALSMALTLLPATALAEGEEDAAGETAAVTFPVNEGSTCEALVESIPESLVTAGGTVTINAASGQADVSYVTVTLSPAAVETLYNSGKPAAAAIETDLGTVRLSDEAIASLRRQLPGTNGVELAVFWNADAIRMARGLVSDAEAYTVEVADMELTDLTDGVLLTFPTQIAGPAVFQVNGDGTYEALEAVAGSGVVNFSTGSLATFVVAPKSEADKLLPPSDGEPDENPDETPDENPDETPDGNPDETPDGKPDEKPEEPLPFTDVAEDAWYVNEVRYVYEKGMMRGDGSETLFNPNGDTTRAMIVAILYRLEGEPAAGVSMFTDVKAGSWYADAVSWAAAHGIVNGRSATEFAPGDPITRQELASILYRYAGSFKGCDVTARAELSSYPDADAISAYAKDAMAWANAQGLVTGSNGMLNPRGSAIRAQSAAILMRFCENVGK